MCSIREARSREIIMGAQYSGFTIDEMLNYLNENSTAVNLEKVDDKWRLYVFSEQFGEYENVGTLLQVVMMAFKPHLQTARKEREEFQKKFREVRELASQLSNPGSLKAGGPDLVHGKTHEIEVRNKDGQKNRIHTHTVCDIKMHGTNKK